ncbi:unnamed protein product [marine sediment metagenome]|uniref:Uncharacterized protein n=1 Tax=marine sediment metagenome TaxID=412755 RepID=X0RXD6_9ZZZZ
MTHSSTWKRAERLAARFYGTERLPGSGAWRRITKSDTMHERLYIEVKLRDHWPKTGVWPIFRDAAEKAKAEGKVPVVVMREKGSSLVLHVVAQGDIDTLVGERECSKNRDEPPPKE